ncbi:PulJ/GspJ family protein [Kineococcus arenarius]|uniref:PulJ/GspJ family protein n=1 Tax=Kineococcus sp. SYSU DK007 TaxID=3383128 RepID=UPI003D7D3995
MTRPAETRGRDAGQTLTELVVAMAIVGIVLAVALRIVVTVTQQTAQTQQRLAATETARAALADIDRQVRSADLITVDGSRTRFRVRTTADTRSTPGTRRCVEWDLTPAGVLRSRSWDETWTVGAASGGPNAWRQLATGVDVSAATVGARPPFSDGSPAGAVVVVDLSVLSGGDADPARVTTTLARRNQPPAGSTPCAIPAP